MGLPAILGRTLGLAGSIAGGVAGIGASAISNLLAGGGGGTPANLAPGPFIPVGADIDIISNAEGARIEQGLPPGTEMRLDLKTGTFRAVRKRRRRKRMLTCSDKADIAFLTGTLGKGQMGQAAVSALIARSCN